MVTNQELQAKRNEAAIAELREMRAQALAGMAETLSNRAVALRLDLFDCMSENAALKAKLAEVVKENERLKANDAAVDGRGPPGDPGEGSGDIEHNGRNRAKRG